MRFIINYVMGLLNKKDKNEVIVPIIKSIQFTDGYGNLEDAAKDKMAYKEWLISMYEMEDKEVRFEDWAQVLYSILSNLTPGSRIEYDHHKRLVSVSIYYVIDGIKHTDASLGCILDEDYPEELIEKIIQDSKHSGALSDID